MSPLDRDPIIVTRQSPVRSDQPPAPARIVAGGSAGGDPVTAEQVREALRAVFDPELGLSIVELGLVYGIEIHDGTVAITMTLTTPGCPIHDVMPGWVREAVLPLPGVRGVEVAITFDPPWSPDRMTAARS